MARRGDRVLEYTSAVTSTPGSRISPSDGLTTSCLSDSRSSSTIQDDLRKGGGIDLIVVDEGHKLKTSTKQGRARDQSRLAPDPHNSALRERRCRTT